MMPHLPRWMIATAVVCTLLWSGWLGMLHLGARASLLDPLEMLAVDLRTSFFGPLAPGSDVVIVAIDDKTVAAAGGYPLERALLAVLISRIADANAQALAIDLLLLDASGNDAELAIALDKLPTVIAAAGLFDDRLQSSTSVPLTQQELLPQAVFTPPALVGMVNVAADAGGTPRHIPMVFNTSNGPVQSFALAAVGLYLGAAVPLKSEAALVAGQTRPLDIGLHLPLRYFGPRGTIPTLSAQAIIDGALPDLSGKLVVLGATATGIGDRFATPFDPVLPGVEVQATGIVNLLQGSQLIRDSAVRKIDVGMTVGLAITAVLLISLLPATIGAVAFAAILTAWLSTTLALFSQGYWFAVALPLVGSAFPLAIMVLARQIFDRRTTQRHVLARQELARFQPQALAMRIADDPDFLGVPQQQDAAIVFIDLSGFTGAAERLGPSRTREILKEFHTMIAEQTDLNAGLVLSFMGDGAMIGFGIPDARLDAAENALRASFALVKTAAQWIVHSDLQGDISGLRAGLHYGPIVLSRLGHARNQHITATGDCVNVASRLMDIGKTNGASVTASAGLYNFAQHETLGVPEPDLRKTVEIRGRRENLDVVMWLAIPQ